MSLVWSIFLNIYKLFYSLKISKLKEDEVQTRLSDFENKHFDSDFMSIFR